MIDCHRYGFGWTLEMQKAPFLTFGKSWIFCISLILLILQLTRSYMFISVKNLEVK